MNKKIRLTEAQLTNLIKKTINKVIKEDEDEFDDDEFGVDVSIVMYSHLSDMMYDEPELMRKRANFLKVLIDKFVPSNSRISKEKLKNLWKEVSSGDFSGKALDEQGDVPLTHDSSDVMHKPGENIKTSTQKKQPEIKKQVPSNKVAPEHPSEPHDDEKAKKSTPRYNPKPIGNISESKLKKRVLKEDDDESQPNSENNLSKAQLMKWLEKHGGEHVRTTEEFNGSKGGIWCSAEPGPEFNGMPIFDYYSENYELYDFGVLKEFEDYINSKGWYSEWNDPGTMMIWPL